MFDRTTRSFLRWRDRGDAEALAAVFDRTAPELLRIALDLCRNIVDAEDLLQATFLAAIESAPRFERGKRVVPWLVGILTHRAQAERRRQHRSPATGIDTEVLPGVGADPAQHATGRELHRATLEALDRLPEPYRQPTMLRIVHGLEPASIALVLQRSPGTVRAQIHRGLEQLRRFLPVGISMSLAVSTGLCGRGLAAVRDVVLAEAGRVAATTAVSTTVATTALVTGITMSKKSAFVAVALLCSAGILGFVLLRSSAEAPPAADEVRAGAAAAATDARSRGATLAETPEPDAATVRAAATSEPGPGAWTLAAQVVDGPTGVPIEGAHVALHGPRSMTLLDLQRELAAIGTPGPTGIPSAHHDWLALPQELPLEVTVNGGSHPFLVPSGAGTPPLAEAETDAAGRFALPAPAAGAVITVRHAGHGLRQIAIAKPPDADLVIDLWPARQIVGFVRTDRDEIVPERLQLKLHARSGVWFAETDAEGRFAAEVAADRVRVECCTPGWSTTRDRVLPSGTRWHGTRDLKVGEQGTVYVTRFGSRRLHVTDAVTGRPIETIRLFSFDENRSPRHCGRFVAPEGWFALQLFELESILDLPPSGRSYMPLHASVTVWSEGYAPLHFDDLDLYGAQLEVVEVRLRRGGLEPLNGRVVRSGSAVAAAAIQLRTFHQLNWQHDTNMVPAAGRTQRDGSFALTAPAGEYLCEVHVEGRCEAQFQLVLPRSEPLLVDLAEAVHVDVAVVDAKGQPQAGHNVAVTGTGNQQRQGKTGPDGHLVLGPFVAGELSAMASLTPTEGSWSGQVVATIDAATVARPSVTLRLPDTTTVRPVLVFEGTPPATGFAGFVALETWPVTDKPEVAVLPDGTVPLDLRPGDSAVRISGPDGRRWQFELPAGAREGHVLTLRWSGLGYAGVVVAAGGSPLAKGRVFATPTGGGPEVSVVTDARGGFRLDGLEPTIYVLGFNRDATNPFREYQGNPYSMQLFHTDAPPALDPVPLRMELTRFEDGRFVGREELVITGRAVDSAGQPLANAIVSVVTLVAQEGGTLQVFPRNGWQQADGDGRVRIVVARGDRYRASVTRKSGDAMQNEDFSVTSSGPVERDFVVR